MAGAAGTIGRGGDMGDMADLISDLADGCDEWSWDSWADRIENLPPFLWLTAGNERVPIRKLETEHLGRILNMIAREKMEKEVGSARLRRLKKEALKRGLEQRRPGFWVNGAVVDFS